MHDQAVIIISKCFELNCLPVEKTERGIYFKTSSDEDGCEHSNRARKCIDPAVSLYIQNHSIIEDMKMVIVNRYAVTCVKLKNKFYIDRLYVQTLHHSMNYL